MAISLSLNNGGAAIVFQTPEGVLFERLDANLQPLGSPTSVTAAGSGWIGGQALLDGGFSVAWQTADGLMAADYDANGLLVVGPHAIGAAPPAAPLAFTSDADGATAILPAGGYVQSQQGASFSVQEFDAHGQAVGPAFVQTHGGVDALGQPLIAPLADGGYVVAYAHYYQWSESLFLARFDAQGQPAGAATAFSWSYSGGEFTNLGPYSVAGLPDGGYVVSWRQYQGASTIGQLYLREYAASGDPVGGAVLVGPSSVSTEPGRIEVLADGRYVVSWTSPAGPSSSVFTEHGAALGYVEPAPPGSGLPSSISTNAATYTAADGVTGMTITGNGLGDTFASNNTGNHLIGGAGADTFLIGRGGDVVTGGAGADAFVFNETPWAGAHITDFTAGQDTIQLAGLLAKSAYAGADPVADGYIRISNDGAGNAQLWSNLDSVSPGAGWWLVTTLDGVSMSSLQVQGSLVTGVAGSGSGNGGSDSAAPGASVSTSAATYAAPVGVARITLTGSAQTVIGNDAGDTFASNNTGNHLIGGAGADTFLIGRGGDIVTGGPGADTFVFNETPWAGAHITDFTAGQDRLDLTTLLAKSAYGGTDPVADGYIKISNDAAGNAQLWSNLDPVSPGAGWWLVTTLDNVSSSSLQIQQGVVTGAAAGSASLQAASVSTSAATYTAPAGVTAITLTGSAQTVTGNNAGDTFTSNNTGNHLIGGTGADAFVIGRGGDIVTGGPGADTFVFNETPWAGGRVTDFTPGLDRIDLTGLLAKAGYSGADPVADGYLKVIADGAGNTQLWSDLDHASAGAGWWLVTTLDGVSTSSVHLNGGWLT